MAKLKIDLDNADMKGGRQLVVLWDGVSGKAAYGVVKEPLMDLMPSHVYSIMLELSHQLEKAPPLDNGEAKLVSTMSTPVT